MRRTWKQAIIGTALSGVLTALMGCMPQSDLQPIPLVAPQQRVVVRPAPPPPRVVRPAPKRVQTRRVVEPNVDVEPMLPPAPPPIIVPREPGGGGSDGGWG